MDANWDRSSAWAWLYKKRHQLVDEIGGVSLRAFEGKGASQVTETRRIALAGLKRAVVKPGLVPGSNIVVADLLVVQRPEVPVFFPNLNMIIVSETYLQSGGPDLISMCLAWAVCYADRQDSPPTPSAQTEAEVLLACYEAQRDLADQLPQREAWLSWVDEIVGRDPRIPPELKA